MHQSLSTTIPPYPPHCLAIYRTKKTAYVFGTYGYSIEDNLPYFTKIMKTNKIHYVDAGAVTSFNDTHDMICGHMTLAWMKTVHRFGIKKALTI